MNKQKADILPELKLPCGCQLDFGEFSKFQIRMCPNHWKRFSKPLEGLGFILDITPIYLDRGKRTS